MAAAAGWSGRNDISGRIEDLTLSAGGLIAALVVDAGPLHAYIDADDRHHAASLALLQSHPGPLVVPVLVVTEVAYLDALRLGVEPEVRFLGDLASGNFVTEWVQPADWLGIADLVARYGELPLGPSVVAAAERLDIGEIATLDRRHFSVVRPSHVPAFVLLP